MERLPEVGELDRAIFSHIACASAVKDSVFVFIVPARKIPVYYSIGMEITKGRCDMLQGLQPL